MENHYIGRNINLSLLSKWIEHFFKKKNFRTITEKETKRIKIIARPTYIHEIIEEITVSISGDPNNFTLKFVTGNRSNFFVKFGRLTTLFGGGIMFLRGVKSQEVEEKLERNFWVYVEEKIDFLTNSARESKSNKTS